MGEAMTNDEFRPVMEAIAEVMREYVAHELAPLKTELERLRAEVATTKVAPFRYRGVWVQGCAEYGPGSFVTCGGSLFHCNVENPRGRPGDSSGDWTLCVQRGRDARDR
jgi:hypothetical protein